jgi:hypothetical protein
MQSNIPWLLLEATSHEGDGLFSDVTYIQRVDTQGHDLNEYDRSEIREEFDRGKRGFARNLPYEATYIFYVAAPK